LTPLAENPVPDGVTLEIVTSELPVFFKVVVSELLLFTSTLPKARVEGVAVKIAVAAVPVPLSVIARGELGALLTNETEPLTLPALVGANATLNVVFAPTAIVCGNERPVELNPVPVTLAAVIVTLALPPFDSVIVCELLFPVITLPKLTLDGFPESCGCTPVPLNGMDAGEPGALLVSEMLPEEFPAALGVNLAVKDVLPPAAIVAGIARPEMLKPAPEAVASVMTVLAFPGLLRVIVAVALPPTFTLLKFTLAGLIVNLGCGGSVPTPLNAIFRGEPGALLVTAMFPLKLPAVVGANLAVNVAA
jgi:hypothetical protein